MPVNTSFLKFSLDGADKTDTMSGMDGEGSVEEHDGSWSHRGRRAGEVASQPAETSSPCRINESGPSSSIPSYDEPDALALLPVVLDLLTEERT